MPKDCYFECHFGVVCSDDTRELLQRIAKKWKAHLSRNIFKKLEGDTYKIMLTARWYEGVATAFQEYVEKIEEDLKRNYFDVDKVIVEFSLYDTKVHHDSSWLTR